LEELVSSPTVRRRKLGYELRRLREGRAWSAEELASHLGWHQTKVSRIETGRSGVKTADLHRILDLFEVEDDALRSAFEGLAREGKRRGWWQNYREVLAPEYADYIGIEAEACTLRNFESAVVPGLLQTPDYARSLIAALRPELSRGQIDALVDVRVARQAVLTKEQPVEVWAILDEAVLRRAVGGHSVMRGQMRRLLESAERPNVTLQVLPFGIGAHDALHGGFVVFGFPEPADMDIVCVENMTSTLYVEELSDVARYVKAFERLRAVALPFADSAALVASAVEEFG
jgi:transcriptional regulator with XRE-family HTH domain